MEHAGGRRVAFIVGLVAILYGELAILGGVAGIAGGTGAAPGMVVSVGHVLLGVSLLAAGGGLIRGQRWAQLPGIVGFFGVSVLELLPFGVPVLRVLSVLIGAAASVPLLGIGVTASTPLLGIAVAAGCGLYLALTSEEFEGGGRRAVPDDEEDGPTHDPLR